MQANPLNKGPLARDGGPNTEAHDIVAQCAHTAHAARDGEREIMAAYKELYTSVTNGYLEMIEQG